MFWSLRTPTSHMDQSCTTLVMEKLLRGWGWEKEPPLVAAISMGGGGGVTARFMIFNRKPTNNLQIYFK